MTGEEGQTPDQRHRRGRPGRRSLALALVGAGSLALLAWVAPPAQVLDQISDMKPAWLLVALGLEVGSCLSYVVVFRRFFPEPARGEGRRVAWISMGAGALLPGGNVSSAAATGWLLRGQRIETRRLVERCGVLLCLLTAITMLLAVLSAALLMIGIPNGPHDLVRAGVPVLAGTALIVAGVALVKAVQRLGGRAPLPLRVLAATLSRTGHAATRPDIRLAGGLGFVGLDMAALWAAGAATGQPLGLPAIAIAYCVGYLATVVPMPAGLGVLDSGLSAALVLYGMHPTASVGAVLVYHAIAIWVPGLGALIAWLLAHRPAASPAAGVARRLPSQPQAPALSLDLSH